MSGILKLAYKLLVNDKAKFTALLASTSHTMAPAFAGWMLLLSGCAIGPKYIPPTATVPPAYKELGAPNVSAAWKPAQPGDQASRGKCWKPSMMAS